MRPACLVFFAAMLVLSPRLGLAAAPSLRLDYAAYVLGLRVMRIEARMMLTPDGYQVELKGESTGVLSALGTSNWLSTAEGKWAGSSAAPARYASAGVWRGTARRTEIVYPGGQPSVRVLEPLVDEPRDAVPDALRRGTVDTLSAMAALLRRVDGGGRCESEARVFDGRRLSTLSAVTVGIEVLSETGRSPFRGSALRCDVEGRLLAGFPRDGDAARLRRPQRGSAWFAATGPGEAPLPVRVTFETRWFGTATLYLVAATPAT